MHGWPGTGPDERLLVVRADRASREAEAEAHRLRATGSDPRRVGQRRRRRRRRFVGPIGRLLIRLGSALADEPARARVEARRT